MPSRRISRTAHLDDTLVNFNIGESLARRKSGACSALMVLGIPFGATHRGHRVRRMHLEIRHAADRRCHRGTQCAQRQVQACADAPACTDGQLIEHHRARLGQLELAVVAQRPCEMAVRASREAISLIELSADAWTERTRTALDGRAAGGHRHHTNRRLRRCVRGGDREAGEDRRAEYNRLCDERFQATIKFHQVEIPPVAPIYVLALTMSIHPPRRSRDKFTSSGMTNQLNLHLRRSLCVFDRKITFVNSVCS